MTDQEKHEAVGESIRAFLSSIGSKGGRVKNSKKSDAVRSNLEKARAVKAHNDRTRRDNKEKLGVDNEQNSGIISDT